MPSGLIFAALLSLHAVGPVSVHAAGDAIVVLVGPFETVLDGSMLNNLRTWPQHPSRWLAVSG